MQEHEHVFWKYVQIYVGPASNHKFFTKKQVINHVVCLVVSLCFRTVLNKIPFPQKRINTLLTVLNYIREDRRIN